MDQLLLSGDTIVYRAEPSVARCPGKIGAIPKAFECAYHQRVQAVMPC